MEGGDLWNMYKTANRKVTKHVAPAAFGAAATIAPLVVGQPELIPPALAIAGLLNEANKASLPVWGKNKKRVAKLEEQERLAEIDKILAERKTHNSMPVKGRGIGPRSRSIGFDAMSPLASATLGHAKANNMLGKMEGYMAEARRANQGLIGAGGNLIQQIPPLQSQADSQNFQFRHTILYPAYHPMVRD